MIRFPILLCSTLVLGCGVPGDAGNTGDGDPRIQLVDTCIQEDDPDVLQYMELDDCLVSLVGCDAGGEYFEDDCGCGCLLSEDEICTTPDNANVLQYMELDACTAALVGCDAGGEYFEDACGCGCLVD